MQSFNNKIFRPQYPNILTHLIRFYFVKTKINGFFFAIVDTAKKKCENFKTNFQFQSIFRTEYFFFYILHARKKNIRSQY